MDPLQLVTAVSAYVQERQLPVNRYLADVNRHPVELPDHVESLHHLLSRLADVVLEKIPLPAYAGHYHSTLRLIESLEALEEGFSRDLPAIAGGTTLRRDISKETLKEMMKAKMTDGQIGKAFGCSAKTIYRRRHELVLHRRALMKSTPDEILREHINEYLSAQNKPKMGVVMTMGHLREIEVPHTREQVRIIMHELDPVQYEARGSETTRRRDCFVPFVNSVWHMDGHHKLIDWKIVIHGAIDGKSHVITFMHASDNNRADTVRALFLEGTEQWGWPQRVRVDHGGENLGVKMEIELRRGEGRGSFIQGGSTHNQRIERLWVDVRRGVVDKYRGIFHHLQALHMLDNKDALHLYCLHFVYLPMINKSLKMWAASWNNHGMSTPGLGGMTPLGQWYMGGIAARQNGFHIDYQPWPSEEEEERLWQEYLEGVRLMDAAEYRVRGQGPDEEREPRERDTHVHVERFGEYLPEVLYDPLTIEYLEREFGAPDGIEADDGMGRYAALLEFVQNFLHRYRR